MKFNILKFPCLIFIIIQIFNKIRSIILKNKPISKSTPNLILNKHNKIKNFHNLYSISNSKLKGKAKINKLYPNFVEIKKEKKFNNNFTVAAVKKSKNFFYNNKNMLKF